MGGNHKNLEALPGEHATVCYNKNDVNAVAYLAGRIYNQLQRAKRPDQKCVVAVTNGAFNIKSSWPFPTPGRNNMYTQDKLIQSVKCMPHNMNNLHTGNNTKIKLTLSVD